MGLQVEVPECSPTRPFGDRLSTKKSDNKGFLFGSFDRFGAVGGTNPCDRFAGRMTTQDGEAGQGSPGAPMAAEATDLHHLPAVSPIENGPQSSDDLAHVVGDPEVRPIEVVVGPRRMPTVIEIQPVVRGSITGVGIRGIERHGRYVSAVGQDDHRLVPMHLKSPVLVVGVSACGRFIIHGPVHLTFDTNRDKA